MSLVAAFCRRTKRQTTWAHAASKPKCAIAFRCKQAIRPTSSAAHCEPRDTFNVRSMGSEMLQTLAQTLEFCNASSTDQPCPCGIFRVGQSRLCDTAEESLGTEAWATARGCQRDSHGLVASVCALVALVSPSILLQHGLRTPTR